MTRNNFVCKKENSGMKPECVCICVRDALAPPQGHGSHVYSQVGSRHPGLSNPHLQQAFLSTWEHSFTHSPGNAGCSSVTTVLWEQKPGPEANLIWAPVPSSSHLLCPYRAANTPYTPPDLAPW